MRVFVGGGGLFVFAYECVHIRPSAKQTLKLRSIKMRIKKPKSKQTDGRSEKWQ